jgi:hypothetical protein
MSMIQILSQDVTMTVSPVGIKTADIKSDLTAYMNSLALGQKFYRSQAESVAIQNGAQNATVAVPGNDVTPLYYQKIRPGSIYITF